MVNRKIRRLLVMDNEYLIGIVTLEDIRRKTPVDVFAIDVVRASDMLARLPIRQIMTKNPKTTSPETPLVDAAQLMLENNVSTLPVMHGSKLVGIITESDIFRAFVKFLEKE
jgi:CBS domain-containing protein